MNDQFMELRMIILDDPSVSSSIRQKPLGQHLGDAYVSKHQTQAGNCSSKTDPIGHW